MGSKSTCQSGLDAHFPARKMIVSATLNRSSSAAQFSEQNIKSEPSLHLPVRLIIVLLYFYSTLYLSDSCDSDHTNFRDISDSNSPFSRVQSHSEKFKMKIQI